MQILNALDLKSGKKAEYNKLGTITQPIQFLPLSAKDDQWRANNMDWLEWQGIKQIRRNSRKLLKNYKLAKGIIDRTDYIVEEDNEYADLIETLTKEDQTALELKFYPIIPNVINLMTGEFAKRSAKVMFRAVDDYSYNEMMEQKRAMIENALLTEAQQKMVIKMVEMGMDPESEEAQQALNPESLKSLPEIESFFKKDYRSMVEEWAMHQTKVDEERFKMFELENMAFRDMLITDREFWHFRMMEDDYEVELWNPLLTFYHKSSDVRYVSQGQWVGKFDILTVADVIDKYGYLMTQEQLESLEAIYPIRSAGLPIHGMQNDGSFYDATRPHSWNVEGPSLAMRQYLSAYENMPYNGDIVQWILSEGEDFLDYGPNYMLRVASIYWKSQRKVGHLTKITEEGEVIQDIVDETFKVLEKPIYNTRVSTKKTKENLIFGEHVDWIWINEVWGGVKIGPNRPTFWGMNNPSGFSPIYLNVNRLPFQFKGDNSLYGCKLPVEGSVFSDRNTRSVSLVDLMKPYQIGYNIVNNQIADILVDELGTVILLDQNALPRHSMGEDWGRNNLAKAYVAMKNFQMLALDTSITNTENALNFQHYQVLNLEQTQRLLSRIQLANYFKVQAFESIGISAQRMGTPVAQESATGIQQSVAASYAQTEQYFTQHSDYLMPRVHQMRTDLAQYYQSSRPSLRLQYLTTTEDKVNFQINGTDLLLRDLNVFSTTKSNHRFVLEQLKQLALTNNTAGASIYDLGNIIKSESVAELSRVLKTAEEKQNIARQQQAQQEQAMQEQMLQARSDEQRMKMEFEASENDKDRQARIIETQIRAAGYGSMVDINKNEQSDYRDAMEQIRKQDEYRERMGLEREKEVNRMNLAREDYSIKQQEIAARERVADKELEIARVNKNKYDVEQKNKKKK
jgi:hypothetical protein